MFRIVALVLAVFLVLFTYLFSNATLEQQQRLPTPIRAAANDILFVLADFTTMANDSFGSRLRQGMRRAGSEIKTAAGYGDAPTEGGILAMNEDMTGHDFSAQLIPNSTFTRAKLDRANFTKAYMDNAAVDSASLTEGRFNQTIMTNSSARGADFSGANFNDADLTGTMAQGAIFDAANINVTLLSSTQFSGASFKNVNMSGSYGDKSIFYAANFTGANISGSDFTKATLDKAVFHRAVLFETHLERASLVHTDFSDADLSMATGLTQKQLDQACGNEATKLPEELTLITCAEKAALKAAAVAAQAEKAARVVTKSDPIVAAEEFTAPEETTTVDAEPVLQEVDNPATPALETPEEKTELDEPQSSDADSDEFTGLY